MELELDLAVAVLLRHLLDWLRLLHLAALARAYAIPCIWLGSRTCSTKARRLGAGQSGCTATCREASSSMVCRFFQGTFCAQFLFGHG